MTSMLLYGMAYSAYCAKVRIALRLKNIPFEEVPPPGGYGSADYRTIVPAGTIPALDIGGRILSESDPIVEYLDETTPHPPLLPDGPEARAVARMAARYHDGRVEPVIRSLFPLVGGSPADTAHFQSAAALLQERLERLSEAFEPSPFIAGGMLTLGDIAYPGTLAMGKRLFREGGIDMSLPATLRGWLATLTREPVVAATVAELEDALETWIASKHAQAQRHA